MIFEMSLKTATVPQQWTRADITALHKSGSRHDAKKYRPISITSPIYKLIDIILNKKLTAFLDSNDLYKLDTSQTGFRPKIGCEVNILRLTETILQQKEALREKYKANQKLWTLFVDFKSAFDSVA